AIWEHQRQGDRVIVLSGALKPFLNAFVDRLELQVPVIGTELQFDQDGICTGKIGAINNGDEKVKRVEEWLDRENDQRRDDRSSVKLWAYADSKSDIPLF